MNQMKKLIINADDFGRHALINEAVARAVSQGALRSATLMPGEPAFDEAVQLAKSLPELGVGVHLTLVDGTPVLAPSEVPTLVTSEGHFLPDHGAFIRQYLQGHISRQDITRELNAQLDKVLDAGLRPTHVDSHQHLHMLPGIFPAVLDLAARHHIRRVRISRGIYGNPFTPWPGVGDLVGKFGLEALALQDRRLARAKGFAFPGHFVGQVAGGAVTADFMRDLTARFPEGVVEVMLHPGLDNRILAQASGWQHDYEGEFAGVCDADVLARLAGQGIQPVNFGALS